MVADEGAPCPRVSFRRAVERLIGNGADAGRVDSLERLLAIAPSRLLPAPDIVRGVIFAPVTSSWAPGRSSFGAGAGPVSGSTQGACLSLVERRWDTQNRLIAKLRIGAFLDQSGDLRWDFGVVARAPSIAALRAGLRAAAAMAPTFAATIDLTPSSPRAAILARRLGGRPETDGRMRLQQRG